MVQFLVGLKGEGKTRQLINMANENVKVTDGNLVFIDDDRRHTQDIHRDIRFVETGKQRISTYQGLNYFIWGMLTQNSDIKHVYIDGLTNLIKEEICNEFLVKFKNRLDRLSDEFHVDFTIAMHRERDGLPEEIKAVLL